MTRDVILQAGGQTCQSQTARAHTPDLEGEPTAVLRQPTGQMAFATATAATNIHQKWPRHTALEGATQQVLLFGAAKMQARKTARGRR